MLATNAEFVQWILKVKSNIDSGTFRPMQLAAAAAYRNDAQWHEEANIHVYAERRALAEEIMRTLAAPSTRRKWACSFGGASRKVADNVEQLTEKILHEARVFITPGFIFGSNGNRYIRISLCAKKEKIAEALERIRKVF